METGAFLNKIFMSVIYNKSFRLIPIFLFLSHLRKLDRVHPSLTFEPLCLGPIAMTVVWLCGDQDLLKHHELFSLRVICHAKNNFLRPHLALADTPAAILDYSLTARGSHFYFVATGEERRRSVHYQFELNCKTMWNLPKSFKRRKTQTVKFSSICDVGRCQPRFRLVKCFGLIFYTYFTLKHFVSVNALSFWKFYAPLGALLGV